MTGRVIPLQGDRHRQIQALLPWYVAGRLDETEQAEVVAHLGGCPDCQSELKIERRLIAEMADLPPQDEDLPGADHGWSQLRGQIEPGSRARGPLPALVAWLAARRPKAFPGGTPAPWLGWVVAVQACLLLVLGTVVWQTTQPAPYRALASATRYAPGNIVVIFRPEITEADLRAVLRDVHARLVDGPTAANAYVLRAPAEERLAALDRLRRRPQVVLAEPVDSEAPGP